MKLMAESLLKNGAIKMADIHVLVAQSVCDINSKRCMYNNCKTCNKICVSLMNIDKSKETTWEQWASVTEERVMKTGETKQITVTMKEIESGTVQDLIDKFHSQLWNKYRTHQYNINNQFEYYRHCRDNLSETECFIHVDFAENYVCKMNKEIQSMHFGAAKPQISLHTGVYYVGKAKGRTFCSVSDSLHHGPSAVWCHLSPVLQDILQENPTVKYIHFFSDGPVTQYRQKGNFYLLSTETFRSYNLNGSSWNFHEAGHGKGIPDAVGGSIKRTADRLVVHGHDIMNAETFISSLKEKESTVKMYLISPTEISEAERNLNQVKLKAVKNTMKIHQVLTGSMKNIYTRDVSCSCDISNSCNGHTFEVFSFEEEEVKCKRKRVSSNGEENQERKKPRVHRVRKKKGSVSEVVDISTEGCQTFEEEEVEHLRKRGPSIGAENPEEKKPRVPREKRNSTNSDVCNKQNAEVSYFSSDRGEQAVTQKRKGVAVLKQKSTDHYLKVLRETKDFEELQVKCLDIALEDIKGMPRSINGDMLTVDERSIDIYPNDVPTDVICYPVQVRADGECLPSCGSVYAYGDIDHVDEIRLRIALEMVKHEDYYLTHQNLCKGLTCTKATRGKNILKSYAMYSDEYIPGVVLSDVIIQRIV